MPRNYKLLLPAAALTLAASNASATWSILIADTRTGEIVIGSATCLESFDLRCSLPESARSPLNLRSMVQVSTGCSSAIGCFRGCLWNRSLKNFPTLMRDTSTVSMDSSLRRAIPWEKHSPTPVSRTQTLPAASPGASNADNQDPLMTSSIPCKAISCQVKMLSRARLMQLNSLLQAIQISPEC